MSPYIILSFILFYFIALISISYFTSKGATNDTFFIGNKKSHWFLIALGLIGDSLSGVTFISVPGKVVYDQFSYLQIVFGYLVGYWIISYVLLPVYYRMNLTSIYTYLQERFGFYSQKTGSLFFILSRLLGAAGRLFLAVYVLQMYIFDSFQIPFFITVAIVILLMIAYTYKGGIKTLVWTDSLQSILLLCGLIFSIIAILSQLDISIFEASNQIVKSEYSKIFFWDFKEKNYFFKQFFGGIFIAIAMTGLDQNMMQKNLSCPNVKDAQKNIMSFSFVMVIVNVLFISLGALLYLYVTKSNIQLTLNEKGKILTDTVFPSLAFNNLGLIAGVSFIVGLTAATFSSADSVLTTLATSFYIDFLGFDKKENIDENTKIKYRKVIHIGFAFLLFIVIIIFKLINQKAIIDLILYIANFTYGPLLGLFAFGIFTKRKTKDGIVPFIGLLSPILCYILDQNSKTWLNGYAFGNELLILNGLITFLFLWLFSKKMQ